MNQAFLLYSIIAFAFTFTVMATALVRKVALKKGIVDDPTTSARKIHTKPIPLLGGVGIYFASLVTVLLALQSELITWATFSQKNVIGMFVGGAFLLIGGVLDDIYNLPPKKQIIWPILAVLVIIISGIGIESLSTPTGGQWFLNQFDFVLFYFNGLPYKITLFSDVFTLVWMLAMMYALKFFDGLDGLVSGVTIFGSLAIFFTSLLPYVAQPDTAMIALIIASCFAGFLAFNFHPAVMYLGESGSMLAGFFIGTLAIISEGKVVTTLLVMSLPILDLLWVIFRRVVIEKSSPTKADRKHIHHRLLDAGYSQRTTALLLYAWVATIGICSFLLQGTLQWVLLLLAVIAFFAFAAFLVKRVNRERL